MIEYSVFTQIDIDRIMEAHMTEKSELGWADAFQEFLNEEAADGWRVVSIKWSKTARTPETLLVERTLG